MLLYIMEERMRDFRPLSGQCDFREIKTRLKENRNMNMKYWGHCLLFMLGLASVCSCTDSEKIVHYRGIAVDDANGSEGLYNPERGFRLETAVDLVTQKSALPCNWILCR